MAAQSAASNHIDITETFVRLYVFLAQSLDRCLTRPSESRSLKRNTRPSSRTREIS
jgi:hypothetical protein